MRLGRPESFLKKTAKIVGETLLVPRELGIPGLVTRGFVDGYIIGNNLPGIMEGRSEVITRVILGLGASRFLTWCYTNVRIHQK